jgi:hypothetical protein
MWKGALKTAAATVTFAVVHSALASERAKGLAEHAVGRRARNGWYRPVYNAVAVGTTVGLIAYIRRQPGRLLWQVRGPVAGVMRVGQLAAGVGFVRAAVEGGLSRLSGWRNLSAWLKGDRDVPPESEAQTRPPGEMGGGARPSGVSGWCRHPLNFFPIPLLWLNPRMGSRLAAFNAVATAYFWLGSLHSDRRLRRQHGEAYERYARRVPLWVPGVGARERVSPPPGRDRNVPPRAASTADKHVRPTDAGKR